MQKKTMWHLILRSYQVNPSSFYIVLPNVVALFNLPSIKMFVTFLYTTCTSEVFVLIRWYIANHGLLTPSKPSKTLNLFLFFLVSLKPSLLAIINTRLPIHTRR